MRQLNTDVIHRVIDFGCQDALLHLAPTKEPSELARASVIRTCLPLLTICRSWHAAAQQRIVRDIWIWHSAQAHALTSLLANNPAVAQFLRSLVLGSPENSFYPTPRRRRLAVAEAVEVVTRCPRVVRIVVNQGDLSEWETALFNDEDHLRSLTAAQPFSHLKELRVEASLHTHSITELLLLMPALETLTLSHVHGSTLEDTPFPSFRLKSISVGGGPQFSWLLHSAVGSLRTLKIMGDSDLASRSDLCAALASVGKSIARLSFTQSFYHGPSLHAIVALCPNLEHLELDPDPFTSELRDCLRAMPETLRSLKLSYAGDHFRTPAERVYGYSSLVMREDVRALRGASVLTHLKSLEIGIRPEYVYIDVPYAELRSLVKLCRARGIRFRFPDLGSLYIR